MSRSIWKRQESASRTYQCFLAFLLLFATGVVAGQEIQFSDSALEQIELLSKEKISRTPAERKIDSNLLLEIKREQGDSLMSDPALSSMRTDITVAGDDTVEVDIKAQVSDKLLKQIRVLGGRVINSFPQDNAIRARLPLKAIGALAEFPAVRSIRPASDFMLNKLNISEGDVAHNADIGRADFGVTGAGIRVGVISDSVDKLASLQASGDLPSVTVLAGQSGNPGTSEGTAMLEIVHDLAPDAELFFATAFGGTASFAQNIRDLRNLYHCDVIVDDVSYFSESPFQDDTVAKAVNEVTADGALYFSSAGNSGNKNDGTAGVWEGNYTPIFLSPGSAWDSINQFGGLDNNQITKGSGNPIVLFWSDPLDGSSNDFDLIVFNSAGSDIICSSLDVQNGNDDPIEIVPGSCNFPGARLAVLRVVGAQSRFLHLNTNRGRLANATTGQTSGHSAAANAFSVAAVDVATAGGSDFTGGAANPVETFSSDGPRRMFYRADGTPYTPGNFTSTGGVVRQKPDIAAADGVATASGPSFNPFYGTSAAAPHAAAISALMLELDGRLTNANDVRDLFAETALDIEAPGVDRDSGYGIVMADRLLAAVDPTNPVRRFDDVPPTHWAFDYINAIYEAGITAGCGANLYCPDNAVTREQMAAFQVRAVEGEPPTGYCAGSAPFADVDAAGWACGYIKRLAELGLTTGCGGGNFCPSATVTREQMAAFLVRAVEGEPPANSCAGGAPFLDVDATGWACPYIQRLKALEITNGCGAGNYCPTDSVQRDEMAAFLTRAFLEEAI